MNCCRIWKAGPGLWRAALLAFGFWGLWGLPVVQAEGLDKTALFCRQGAKLMEQVSGLPEHLLIAIARAESGRSLPGKGELFAWPWTIMAEGRGRFLPSKEAAIAEVQRLQAKGVTNIDVGCMQVNLYYHGQAFTSLEEAFDPLSNMAYAAAFLSDLRLEARSWTKAVGYYHTRNHLRSLDYRRKVLHFWRLEKKRAREMRRTGG